VAVWKDLVAEYPARTDFRRELTRSLTTRGQEIAPASGLARTTEAAFREAQDLWKELATQFPDDAEPRQALAAIRETLVAVAHNVLWGEKAHVSIEAMDFFQQAARDFPDVPEVQQEMAECLARQGVEALHNNWRGQAEEAFRKAGGLWKGLSTEHPTEPSYRRGLARSHLDLANYFREYRQTKEAEAAYHEAQALLRQLIADFPKTATYRLDLARVQNSLGEAFVRAGRKPEAETAYREAITVTQQLVKDMASVPDYQRELAASHTHLANLLLSLRHKPEAEAAYRDALAVWKQLVADFPDSQHQQGLANGHNLLGVLLYSNRRLKEAEAAHREALAVRQTLVADWPKSDEYRNDLAGTMVNLALVLRDEGELEAARQMLEQAQPHHQAALAAKPYDATYLEYFRNNRFALVETLLRQGQHVEAAAAIQALPAAPRNWAFESYRSAGFLARCVALAEKDAKLSDTQRAERARSYGDRAVSELQQAVRNGLRDARMLTTPRILDPLRARPDFQKLVAELEKKSRPGMK
jgi:tetratricopeptide (TPR) repeat protein